MAFLDIGARDILLLPFQPLLHARVLVAEALKPREYVPYVVACQGVVLIYQVLDMLYL